MGSSFGRVLDKQHLATGYAIEHYAVQIHIFFPMFHEIQYSNFMTLLGQLESNPQAPFSSSRPVKAAGK